MSANKNTEIAKSNAMVGSNSFESFFEGTTKVEVGGDFWHKENQEGVENRAIVTGFEIYKSTKEVKKNGKTVIEENEQDVCRLTFPNGDSMLIGDQAFVSQSQRISKKLGTDCFPIYFTYLGLTKSEKTSNEYHNYKIELAVKK
jgi:hypothetical protein